MAYANVVYSLNVKNRMQPMASPATSKTEEALTLNSRVMFTQVDDEYVLLHLDKGEYFSLNPMGVILFDLLKEGLKLAEVENKILATFDIDQATLSADLEELVTSLTDNQIFLPHHIESQAQV